MNYSASEDYFDKVKKYNKKRISTDRIRKRWFRNFYVLYQSKGYCIHNTFVMEFGKFDPNKYWGEYYGPFTESQAIEFSRGLCKTHEDFIFG